MNLKLSEVRGEGSPEGSKCSVAVYRLYNEYDYLKIEDVLKDRSGYNNLTEETVDIPRRGNIRGTETLICLVRQLIVPFVSTPHSLTVGS